MARRRVFAVSTSGGRKTEPAQGLEDKPWWGKKKTKEIRTSPSSVRADASAQGQRSSWREDRC